MISFSSVFNRRRMLLAAAASALAPVAAKAECRLGPPEHQKGPIVWGGYDQVELDAAYDQDAYQAFIERTNDRLSYASSDLWWRRGYPDRHSYGEGEKERLDFYSCGKAGAPLFVFIHGGTWRYLNAANSGFAAEMFMDAGAHFAALDFDDVRVVGGDLRVLSDQVSRGIAWLARNAEDLRVDPARIYVGGHSSGGHLVATALTTDWKKDFGLPRDVIKGGLCISGMYALEPVFLSWRRSYLATDSEIAEATSPIRHVSAFACPIYVAYGTFETPEFQRQAIDFAAALKAGGQEALLIKGVNYHHQDMWEALGNPYGPSGRTALEMMGLVAGDRQ